MSLQNACGTVEDVVQSVRQVNTRRGPADIKGLVVDGQLFETGFRLPNGVNVGDIVSFSWEEKFGKPQIDDRTVTRGGSPSGIPITLSRGGGGGGGARPASTGGGKGGYGSSRPFPIPGLHGDRAIVRQNSLTNAVKVYTSLYDPSEVNLSDSNEFANEVIELARRFEAYSCGDLEADAVAAMSKTPS